MNDSEAADEPPLPQNNRPWAKISHLIPFGGHRSTDRDSTRHASASTAGPTLVDSNNHLPNLVQDDTITGREKDAAHDGVAKDASTTPQAASAVAEKGDGEKSAAVKAKPKLSVVKRLFVDIKQAICSSWINWLLVFVPIGIAFGIMSKIQGEQSPISPNIVFAINAIAIIPLAYLLCFATESVAAKLGDTLGALLNVTFGNAVELIIFIIALVAKEIRIVQASLLGSILANLLLILGMCFLFGGLRFREQLYNSAVSQMSACLLSLSVVSLLLPTAFHASFNNTTTADKVVVKVSRGTSVVLLFVYILYLLFQLKSHAYMYESTPQHLIDEESHPGVLAEMMHSSSSSSDTSSSDGSDSDRSSSSHNTTKRFRRALRRRRRKSNASSKDTPSAPSVVRTPSSHTHSNSFTGEIQQSESPMEMQSEIAAIPEGFFSGDEADDDGERLHGRKAVPAHAITFRDFEHEKSRPKSSSGRSKEKKKSKHSKRSKKAKGDDGKTLINEPDIKPVDSNSTSRSPPQVGFVSEIQEIPDPTGPRRPFNLRHLSSHVRPSMVKPFPTTVFSPPQPQGPSLSTPIPRPIPRHLSTGAIRRTTSLPEMQRMASTTQPAPISAQPLPHLMPTTQSKVDPDAEDLVAGDTHMTRTSAIALLLLSTGLVAASAEFLVSSIDYLVSNSGISQAFVGLIILPIVGNAAEHVTAVTMASKNKMDLAIGVALGSSIQIALFVTPVIVLLGWALDTDMSLYFSLFETISLFASAFIVNYLMIDGRSNYLEGALLIAAYVIIAVAAFFYPTCNLSVASGPADASSAC